MAVDVSADEPRTREFYEQFGFTVPAAFDAGQEVAGRRFGVIGTPTNYLLDRQGRIVWRHYGYRPGDEIEVRERIEELLTDE